MHPLWLKFKNNELESRFQNEQKQDRVARDKVTILSVLVYELALQYRHAFFRGARLFPFVVRFATTVVPLSALSWCHFTFSKKDLIRLQPTLALTVKLLYVPICGLFLECITFPEEDALDYYKAYASKPYLFAFGAVLSLLVTASLIPALVVMLGTRVGFKREFCILLVGVPCKFWWTRKEIAHLSSLTPMGQQFMQDVSANIDAYANVVLHFTNSSSHHTAPSPHNSDQVLAFLNFFGIGVLCAVWLWWCELSHRVQFLKRLILNHPNNRHIKAVAHQESSMLWSGVDVAWMSGSASFVAVSFVFFSCMGAITWQLISYVFQMFQ